MKQLCTIIFLFVLAACNNTADSEKTETDTSNNKSGTAMQILTDQQKSDGWQELFDGQTFRGWHKYGGGPTGSAWKIADGTIYMDTSSKGEDGKVVGGGDLITDEEFDNFHLKMEWKISKNGNSGIIFYVNEDTARYKKSYETGPEMQVLDNDGHPDGKIPKHRAGDLYDLVPCTKETVKAVGEWNFAEIRSLNGKLDFFLNGDNIVSTNLWDDNWKKMVAASKFKEWKDFATFKSGKICLQDHDNLVWFRNIVIKRL